MDRILVVDDDAHIREVVRYALESAGFVVTEVGDASAAFEAFERERPDAVVLDIVLPGEDGLTVCRELRRRADVPILFLSSRDEELDRIVGLEIGADDYVTKPFSPRELVARVRGVLRRLRATPDGGNDNAGTGDRSSRTLAYRDLELDPVRHRVRYRGSDVVLTVTEFGILETLLRHPCRVYTRSELIEGAHGPGHHTSDRTVDSHVRRIRSKLVAHGDDPIETVHGVGYRLHE